MWFQCNWIDVNHTNTKNIFTILECSRCQLEKVHPLPSYDEIALYYPQNYYSYQDVNSNKTNTTIFEKIKNKTIRDTVRGKKSIYTILFGNRVLFIPTTMGNQKKYLDIWCWSGVILENVKQYGWDCYWYDIGEKKETWHIKRDSNIVNINRWNLKFDFISIWHTLEHVPNPREYIKVMSSLLNQDGVIRIGIPNTNSWYAKRFWRYWNGKDTPRHLFNFSDKNIRQLLEQEWLLVNKIHYIWAWWFWLSFIWMLQYYTNLNLKLLTHPIFVIAFGWMDVIANLLKKWDIICLDVRKK